MSHESTCSVLKWPSCLPHGSTIPASSPGNLILLPQDLKHDTIDACFFYMFQINPSLYIYIYRSGVPDPLISITTTPLSLRGALMASLLHQLSLVFLLFLASSSFQIHARESRFFVKTTRTEDTKEATPIPEETPTAVKIEDPSTLPPLQSLSGTGYGLYGHGQDRFTPATATYYHHHHNSNNNNKYNYDDARPNTELASENDENRYNGGYNHASQFKYAYNRPSKFSNQEFDGGSYETKGYGNYVDPNNQYGGSYETKGYSNYVDPNKQYGLSDTRFFENGRYFYDVDAERNRNQYETYPTRGNGVYGKGNAYEHSNTIGGYQNNQVKQDSREDYVP